MDPDGRSSTGEERLRHEQRLAAAVEMATDAIIVIDDGGRIRLFNAAAEHLFCCSERDAINNHLECFIPPRLHPRYRADMDQWRKANPQARDVRVWFNWPAPTTMYALSRCDVCVSA